MAEYRNCETHDSCQWLHEIGSCPAVNPLPCKIGDTVWAIRNINGVKQPKNGIVGEMFYTDDMRLCIVVRYIARGELGKKVFATREEAEAAIGGADSERKAQSDKGVE